MENIIIAAIILLVVIFGARSIYQSLRGKKKSCCSNKDCIFKDCGKETLTHSERRETQGNTFK